MVKTQNLKVEIIQTKEQWKNQAHGVSKLYTSNTWNKIIRMKNLHPANNNAKKNGMPSLIEDEDILHGNLP